MDPRDGVRGPFFALEERSGITEDQHSRCIRPVGVYDGVACG